MTILYAIRNHCLEQIALSHIAFIEFNCIYRSVEPEGQLTWKISYAMQ